MISKAHLIEKNLMVGILIGIKLEIINTGGSGYA